MPVCESSDTDLALAVVGGDANRAGAAEEELCRRLAPRIRAFGRRHLGRRDAVDDLVQRTLELVIQKLRTGEVRNPDHIGSFVLGVARNTAREFGRKHRREQSVETPVLEQNADTGTSGDISADTFRRRRLVRCLGGLSERERTIVVMSFFEDLSAPDLAVQLGLDPGHVRVIRHRAISKLRACMIKEGGTS